MKFCAYCGNALNDDMLFCPKCGREQVPVEDSVIRSENINNHVSKESVSQTGSSFPSNQKKKKKGRIAIAAIIGGVIILASITAIIILLQNNNTNVLTAELAPSPNTASEAIVSPITTTSEPTEEPYTIVGNTDAIERISRSVVKLTCYDEFGNEYASGSGFFAFESNLIVTNYHVIEGNVYSIKASSDGKEFFVDTIVNYNERYDLALLSVSKQEIQRHKLDFEPLPIGDSSALKVSEHITAIGVPLGISKTVSDGMISGFYEDNGINLIQFTAPISPGSSGGALLNDSGEVIGITSASFSSGQNFNLTVPSSYISILYNANPHNQQISSFHDQLDHLYSVDYCLANYDKLKYYKKSITIYGYVSSFLRVKLNDGTSRFKCYLVSNAKDVNGTYCRIIESETSLASLDRTKTEQQFAQLDKETARSYDLLCISIMESKSYPLDDSLLVPGNMIVITGTISGYTSTKYPEKTMLGITPSHIEEASRILY